eukprot:CAMPEP_0185011706 /NCGR_PEP_ID=MMETSP1098-20130426/97926_1 /TAXON_ID=89044 /ORGANISM="Spumella elongata, Strain CCAP 955/1" /LENGTH=480 /DNA_ID=CAMNT_0027540747 /DNA_START=103 /DNA_END=1545 /DNA_ORIENTATION=-
MSVLGCVGPDVPTFNKNNDFTIIETDIDFNFEVESCAVLAEGMGSVYKGGAVFPQGNEDLFGLMAKNERQVSPQGISDLDAFMESNSTKLNNLKRQLTPAPATTFEMPQLKRTAPSFDAYIEVSISQESMQRCVADYFNNRGGVTFEFCPNMKTWSVLILHGAQMCALSFQMSPAGTTAEQKIRFSGKLENGSTALDTLHCIINQLREHFDSNQDDLVGNTNNNNNNNNKNTLNAATRGTPRNKLVRSYQPAPRKCNIIDYSLPCNRRILEMMNALARDRSNLIRQQEAVQCLCEMSLDATLVPVLLEAEATQALLEAYAASATDVLPRDHSDRAAYYAALFAESAAVSHAKHEIALFALAALANLSHEPDATLAILNASTVWAQLRALHASFTPAEQTVTHTSEDEDSESDDESACAVVTVPCLVGSLDRLRRRAMHRFSATLQRHCCAATDDITLRRNDSRSPSAETLSRQVADLCVG